MTRRLRPVPDTPPRAVAYVRVSDERGRGEQLLSPQIQASAIEDHCTRSGYDLVKVLEDVDLTGRFWKRRQVEQAIALIEAGDADVLVVWKVSRVARNRRDWAIAVDRIEAAGGRLESATEPNDTSASGRFGRGVLAELAAFESERIGETWQEVHARRLASGRPANGKPRWGYTYDAATKTHVPDPRTGPVLADVYRRYVAGESIYSLVRWLNSNGHTTTPGYSSDGPGPWSDRSLRRVLDSGFAAGLLTVGGNPRPGVHEPLIDEATWEAYQVARGARRVTRSSERSQYLLSGLVRCACGSAMTAGQFGTGHVAKFRCKAARDTGRHNGGYVTMHLVEAAVLAWVRELAADVEASADAHARATARTRRRAIDAHDLERDLTEVAEQLATATRRFVRGVIPEAAYVVVRDELEEQQRTLAARRMAAKVESRRGSVTTAARALLEGWDELPVEQRRGVLRELIARVVVTPGRPRALVEVVPADAG